MRTPLAVAAASAAAIAVLLLFSQPPDATARGGGNFHDADQFTPRDTYHPWIVDGVKYSIGKIINRLPNGSVEMKVDRDTVYYYRGVFMKKLGTRYQVIDSPVGAVVADIHEDYTPIAVGREEWYYFQGTFYRWTGRGYRVETAPIGVTVPYLPQGKRTRWINGKKHFGFGTGTYKPYYLDGDLVYKVIKR